MTPFKDLWEMARRRKGGHAAVETELPHPATAEALHKVSDSQWLSDMGKRVFSAGFNWKVVEDKWPAFETAFDGFDPWKIRLLSDDALDDLAANRDLIRNRMRMEAIRENAAFLCALSEERRKPAGHVFADWPKTDYVGLLELLKTRGARLGGLTGMYLLRWRGVDGFVLSTDVVAALTREGVIEGAPTSKKAMRAIQTAFDIWHAESGRPMMQISKVLALTVGPTAEA
ncbi:MAG: DNA-3-methyladenine glycosylase I [Albimonas sp.]|uniref:DNA-3-methyladenine glycosylase I n=1 Tax=Albimonas sp. TaxID=1872425 RepID=UPI004056D42B|tara:strand:+ start:34 stop:720 length:687 start_codon:yes stop_codon:yes gene_type:complete